MNLVDSAPWVVLTTAILPPFSYNRSCVFERKFPRMGQEAGEDTPKEKRENRMEFPYQQERISPEETCRKHSVSASLVICRYVPPPYCVLSLERENVLMLITYQPSWVFADTLVKNVAWHLDHTWVQFHLSPV